MLRRFIRLAASVFILSSVVFILSSVVYADLGDTTLKKGVKHPDVAKLQEKLNMLGYFKDDEYTEYFGEVTEAALKAFQKDVGLKQDGVAGTQTFKLLNIKITQAELLPEDFTPLKQDDSGENVAEIQKKLQKLEIYDIDITSEFDEKTVQCVTAFQQSAGLPQTGIVDNATVLKLNEAVNKIAADRASASRRIVGAKVIEFAKKYLGKPYAWGASSGNAFDCSGFAMYVMKKFNVNLDHTASGQFKSGTQIDKTDLLPGDLVFFTTYKKGASHVGIYIGDNKFIHASSGVDRVTITDLDEAYYRKRFVGARRYNIMDSE